MKSKSFKILAIMDRSLVRFASACGALSALAMILLLINVFYDVVMRYVFNDVSIAMQELEWHLFALVFMLGIPYAMAEDGHVRVDILYDSHSDRTKAWINLFGSIGFVIPFVVLVAWFGTDFAYQAYEINESSGDPGGLPHRWLIKSLIPVSSVLVALAGLGMAVRAVRVLLRQVQYSDTKQGAQI